MSDGFRKGQYALVTGAYWAFTLTDGALRMLVLLFLHQLGRSPLEIATLFLFYEFFGIVTNLAGGALGARFGLRLTLVLGLALQITALGVLGWQHAALSLPLVMGMQSLSGVAKDLTKMSAKSYMKFLVPKDDAGGLMRVVAWLTGSKNTLKGAGFFLGGWLLGVLGFQWACWAMACGLAVAWLVVWITLPKSAGKAKRVGRIREWIADDRRVLWLSCSRLFLFASRDVWFVLALPLFLATRLDWSHSQVGAFLALWVIGYGMVQALAPRWLGSFSAAKTQAHAPRIGWRLAVWTLSLLAPLTWLAEFSDPSAWHLGVGLGLFGLIFATCSALHSYAIVALAASESVSQQVGGYYAANAVGRFVGTALSGALFQWAENPESGLRYALWGALALAGIGALFCIPLALAEKRSWTAEQA